MKESILILGLAFFHVQPGFAANSVFEANEKSAKAQAAVEIVLDVSGVREVKDKSLVFGGYSCFEGTIKSIVVSKKTKHEELVKAHKVGDKVSVYMKCDPDDVPAGPGQEPTNSCSKVRKAKQIRVWSGGIQFPQKQENGKCDAPDAGFEVIQ